MADVRRTQSSKSKAVSGPRRVRHVIVTLLSLFLVFALVFCNYIGLFNGNVHTIVPGKVYRSAQLAGGGFLQRTAAFSGNSLDDVIHRYNIHTVINLRGGNLKDPWYRTEIETTRRDGARHLDYGFSAIRLPPPDTLRGLLGTFDHLRPRDYPVLMHCNGGADRTGLTSAIYVNVYTHEPLDEAVNEQLNWHFGHFAFTRTGAMDRFFALYRNTGGGLALRDWILKRYPAIYASQPESLKAERQSVKPTE